MTPCHILLMWRVKRHDQLAPSADPATPQVLHYQRDAYILLQSENGPCPLLAIANILLLSGKLSLSPRAMGSGVV